MERGDSSILDDLFNSPEFLGEATPPAPESAAVARPVDHRQSVELLAPLLGDASEVYEPEQRAQESAAPAGPVDNRRSVELLAPLLGDISENAAPGGVALGEIRGGAIKASYPNDLHFLCGCANFDPCGHNDTLRSVAREHFEGKIRNGDPSFSAGQCKVRGVVGLVMDLAHVKAKEITNFQGSRFRIWKPNLAGKKRLNESIWEDSVFTEITDNLGALKKNLEWPLRRALEDARKAAGTASGGSDHDDHHKAPVPEEQPSAKRVKRENASNVVDGFVLKYEERGFMDALNELHADRGPQNIEEWAKDVYVRLRDHPEDEHAKKLNLHRKKCLNLLYDLVKAWETHDFSEEFEQAIDCVFKTRRLVRVLSVCLPMDRAQSLYSMRNWTSSEHGMHWYSQLHLEKDNTYAREHAEEQAEWEAFIQGYDGEPTMNKKMFRLLFSDRLKLRSNKDFFRWSMPAKMPTQNN